MCGTSATLSSALLKRRGPKELPKVKPDKWGCVQASQLWYVHMCTQKKEKKRAREQERKGERERKTDKAWEYIEQARARA